jgi:hypothetical protein
MTRKERQKLEVGDVLYLEGDDRIYYVTEKFWAKPLHNWWIQACPVGLPEIIWYSPTSMGDNVVPVSPHTAHLWTKIEPHHEDMYGSGDESYELDFIR